jgi:hypothetical protein
MAGSTLSALSCGTSFHQQQVVEQQNGRKSIQMGDDDDDDDDDDIAQSISENLITSQLFVMSSVHWIARCLSAGLMVYPRRISDKPTRWRHTNQSRKSTSRDNHSLCHGLL